MPTKIEGYRERGSKYEERKPKEYKAPDLETKSSSADSSMQEFMKRMETRSAEDHMKEISSGRGNGIPDNYKEKKTK